jgi:hypothetical protein
MAEPVPTPTLDQLETFSEITYIAAENALEAVSQYEDQDLADLKWTRTLDDLDAWDAMPKSNDDTKRLGEIEFFEGKDVETRLAFRNKVRRRYGYPPLLSEDAGVNQTVSTAAISAPATVSADW